MLKDCKHGKRAYVFSSGKIARYMQVCRECGKFIKWVSNIDWEKIKDNALIISESNWKKLKKDYKTL